MGSAWWFTLCLVWQAVYQANGLKMQISNLSSCPKLPPTAPDPTDVPISISNSLKSTQEITVDNVNSPFVTVDTEPSKKLQQIVVSNALSNLIVKELERLNSINNQDSGTPISQLRNGAEIRSNPNMVNPDTSSNTDVYKHANEPRTKNMNINNLLRLNAIINQEKIKENKKDCNEKGLNTDILNDVPSFISSDSHIYSAPKTTVQENLYNLYDTQLATEDPYDVNNLIRSKNSISHFQPLILYENLENSIDDSNPSEINSFNNLYNLQSLPDAYVTNQNVESHQQFPVNSNVHNPWAKDSILQYLNSMQSLKNYQSLATNKPLNEYTFNGDPRVLNNNAFNTPIPQMYKQNAAINGIGITENNLEDLFSLENDREKACGSQSFQTTSLEGHQQTPVCDSITNINSIDTRTPTNSNLNNLYNLLYSQNAKYRNKAVSNAPFYENPIYNTADHVNPFESNSLEVPLKSSLINFDTSVPNLNLAQENFPVNNVLSNYKNPNNNLPISTVFPTNVNEMPILERTLDSRLRNNYFGSNNQLPNIELHSPSLIEPVNVETLSENLNLNLEPPYDTLTIELIESIPSSITDKRSAPANPKRFYDTRAFTTPNIRPNSPFKSGIGLNSISPPITYAGRTGTKLSIDRIPIKPELLASIKPLSASPYSSGFGVDSLLNMGPLSNYKNDKHKVTDVIVHDNLNNNKNPLLNANNHISLSVNTFNNAFQEQTPVCELSLDPVTTVPIPYHLDIISNALERSHDFNFVNPFITNTPNLVQPKLTNSIADDLQKLLSNHQTIHPPPRADLGGILPLPFAPEIPSLTIDPWSYTPVGSFYPSIIPQFPTVKNVPTLPIVNPFPQHATKVNVDISTFNISPYHNIPSNVDPIFQYSIDPTNDFPCAVPFDETPYVQSFDQAFIQLPDPNNFPITNLFAPEHNPLYSYPSFTPSEMNSSPLHYISAAPEIIEVPYNFYNDAFNTINSHTSQNLVGNFPIHNRSPVSFNNFDTIYPQTGFMNPVSNLPNVYPSSNIMIPQALPTISYTNVVANNPLSPQVDKLFSPSGVVTSINDAASIVAKSAISSLIAKKLKSKAQNTPVSCQTECLPPVYPYIPNCYDSYAMTAFDSPFLFEQFYSLPPTPKKSQTNPQLYNGFDVPDILSHLNFNEIPDLVRDYPDVTDFDFDFETEMKKSKPATSSVTVNIVPVIDEFSFEFRSPSSNPLIGYNDYPSISPSYLPTPNINADAYLTQQVIDMPALTSMMKGKDCKELGRLLELLVMSELINNNEYDLDALEAILAMLCVS